MRLQQPFIHVGRHIAWLTSMYLWLFDTHSKKKPMNGSDQVVVLVPFRRELVVYLNAFSGEATTEFPSTLQMARGGVCFLTC